MTSTTTPQDPATQRDALDSSERDASAKQPENYKDAATAEKIVKIPAVDKTEKPIKGLDPK